MCTHNCQTHIGTLCTLKYTHTHTHTNKTKTHIYLSSHECLASSNPPILGLPLSDSVCSEYSLIIKQPWLGIIIMIITIIIFNIIIIIVWFAVVCGCAVMLAQFVICFVVCIDYEYVHILNEYRVLYDLNVCVCVCFAFVGSSLLGVSLSHTTSRGPRWYAWKFIFIASIVTWRVTNVCAVAFMCGYERMWAWVYLLVCVVWLDCVLCRCVVDQVVSGF